MPEKKNKKQIVLSEVSTHRAEEVLYVIKALILHWITCRGSQTKKLDDDLQPVDNKDTDNPS